jgi:MFS family permease
MWIQAAGIGMVTVSRAFSGFVTGAVLLGIGTAMVYPTLLAAIGDVAHPSWRASAVGVYRLWRDLGYVAGALLTGVVADLLGFEIAIGVVALMTALSGLLSGRLMNAARKLPGAGTPAVVIRAGENAT